MTKSERIGALYVRLSEYGFTIGEIGQLLKIERILHRWAEAECNGDIQRDETSGETFAHYGRDRGPFLTVKVRDRETAALKKLATILAARNSQYPEQMEAYHQGDPRGCALYIVPTNELLRERSMVAPGESRLEKLPIEAHYNRGIAVCS